MKVVFAGFVCQLRPKFYLTVREFDSLRFVQVGVSPIVFSCVKMVNILFMNCVSNRLKTVN